MPDFLVAVIVQPPDQKPDIRVTQTIRAARMMEAKNYLKDEVLRDLHPETRIVEINALEFKE